MAEQHMDIVPDPCVETDAHGRISYTIYDNIHSLRIDLPQREHYDTEEEYQEDLDLVRNNCSKGRRITLPTPFPESWRDIKQDDHLRVACQEVPIDPLDSHRFTAASFSCSFVDGPISMYDKKCVHPHIKSIPWSPESICHAIDYKGPAYPPGVENRGDTDAHWDTMSDALSGIPYDQVPHWTLRFKSEDIQRRRALKPLPPFDHHLFKDADISRIIFLFDDTRLKGNSHGATAEIVRALLADYVAELEQKDEDASRLRKRRVV